MTPSASTGPTSSSLAAAVCCTPAEDTEPSLDIFGSRGSPVYRAPRKRSWTTCFQELPMRARPKSSRSRRHSDDVTATTRAPRYGSSSRPPETPRGTTLQDRDERLSSPLQLRRRRPSSATSTEYLGVSSIAFAPPLRRYIQSPQHGRGALRSSQSPPSTRILHSPWEARRGSFSRDNDGSPLDTVGGEIHDSIAVPQAQRSSGNSPTGLLTPVGPDWCETTPVDQSQSQESRRHTELPAGNSGDHGSSSVGSQSRVTTEALRSELQSNIAVGTSGPQRCGDGEPESMQLPSESSRNSPQSSGSAGPEDYRGGTTARRSYRRRRILRRRAWDLLTGRRIERGRRKGSRDINVPEVFVIIT